MTNKKQMNHNNSSILKSEYSMVKKSVADRPSPEELPELLDSDEYILWFRADDAPETYVITDEDEEWQPVNVESSEAPGETLHCPKCGEAAHNAHALLGHIYSSHWILDDDELPEGFER